jgi:hypothetical protein
MKYDWRASARDAEGQAIVATVHFIERRTEDICYLENQNVRLESTCRLIVHDILVGMKDIVTKAARYTAFAGIALLMGTLGVAGCKATVETPGPAVQGPAGAPGAPGPAGAAGATGETGSQGAPAAATKSSESSTTTETNTNPDTGSSTTTEKSKTEKGSN